MKTRDKSFAYISLSENVQKQKTKISRIQKSFDVLVDKTSWFASEHLKLLSADREVLEVYARHLAELEKELPE